MASEAQTLTAALTTPVSGAAVPFYEAVWTTSMWLEGTRVASIAA